MTKLATLRSQLGGLRRARSSVRWATAWSSLATAVLWSLAGVFVLDWLFALELVPRLVMILLAAAVAAWAYQRFTRPLLGRAESEIEMALLVERQQQIDSDLVAAIQFESPDAARWGSVQLEGAVIDYVAAVGRGINVFEGFSREQMTRRGLALAITAVSLVALAGLFPGHAIAFLNRLCLGSMHYPSRTAIERIVVNGRSVLVADEHGSQPISIKAPQGRPLSLMVVADGVIPAQGTILFQSRGASRSRTTVELAPLTEAEAAKLFASGARPAGTVLFSGEMPRLLDSVTYKVFLGDAWTDAARIDMVPLPTIETRLVASPPRYARSSKETPDPTARQISVLEGTTIDLTVECTNQKPLATVKLITKAGSTETTHDLVKSDQAALQWKLPGGETPLTNIRKEVGYEIHVTDGDGLSLETPIRGTIRIRPDRPPTASAEVVHKVVLPTASPVIEYRATDDYGISRLALVAEIERQDAAAAGAASVDLGQGVVAPAREVPTQRHRFELAAGLPILADRLPVASRHTVSLSQLGLAKGDRVKLTLEVTDYRGENEQGQSVGQTQASDALVLEISDESGVLAAISQADERSEQQLTDIIKRQLGIGDSP